MKEMCTNNKSIVDYTSFSLSRNSRVRSSAYRWCLGEGEVSILSFRLKFELIMKFLLIQSLLLWSLSSLSLFSHQWRMCYHCDLKLNNFMPCINIMINCQLSSLIALALSSSNMKACQKRICILILESLLAVDSVQGEPSKRDDQQISNLNFLFAPLIMSSSSPASFRFIWVP